MTYSRSFKQKLELASEKADVTNLTMAEAIGMSTTSFNKRAHSDRFSYVELSALSRAFNAEFVCYFKFKDGTMV